MISSGDDKYRTKGSKQGYLEREYSVPDGEYGWIPADSPSSINQKETEAERINATNQIERAKYEVLYRPQLSVTISHRLESNIEICRFHGVSDCDPTVNTI